MTTDCVIGEDRKAAERLLAEMHERRPLLDGAAVDHVEFLWNRRHIQWPRRWVEKLETHAMWHGLEARP